MGAGQISGKLLSTFKHAAIEEIQKQVEPMINRHKTWFYPTLQVFAPLSILRIFDIRQSNAI